MQGGTSVSRNWHKVLYAHVERAFSLVSLLKDDTRNRMGLLLLSSIMDVRTGLVRNGFTSATFKPPRQLLERFDSTIY